MTTDFQSSPSDNNEKEVGAAKEPEQADDVTPASESAEGKSRLFGDGSTNGASSTNAFLPLAADADR